MAITGKVKTMYEDAEKTKAIFPRTKTSAISDADGKNLDVIIEELKKSVSDGKTLVANAITEKGVSTSSNDTFETMAINISNISGFKGLKTTVATHDTSGSGASLKIGMLLDGRTVLYNVFRVDSFNPYAMNVGGVQIDYGSTLQYHYTMKATTKITCNGATYNTGDVVAQWSYQYSYSSEIQMIE